MSVKAETALILSDFGGFHKMIMTKYQKNRRTVTFPSQTFARLQNLARHDKLKPIIREGFLKK